MADHPRKRSSRRIGWSRNRRTGEIPTGPYLGDGEPAAPPPAVPAAAAAPAAEPPRRGDAERVAELEAQLAAAQRTINALIDKAERGAAAASPEASVFEAAARMEQLITARTREVEEKSQALAQAYDDLRDVTANLDQIVRQRTRALTESEAQLRRKNAELDRLNRSKAEFIAIAAHELRTPMTSVVGYLDLILESRFGELSETLRRPMVSLSRNAHRLRRLVEEMLDVSRLDTGRISLRRTPCDLGDLVQNVVDEVMPLATGKQQAIAVDIAGPLLSQVDGDKIQQVVSNLLANAIRYTPEGGQIAVRADLAPQDQYAGSWVRIRVRDNGIGIPEALRGRIFEPFSDVNTAKHHTSSGPDSAGLGLYIARGLLEMHGGIITVDSEVGKFTEFTVLLPTSGS